MENKPSNKTFTVIIIVLITGVSTYLLWKRISNTIPKEASPIPRGSVDLASKKSDTLYQLPDDNTPNPTAEEEAKDLGMTMKFSDPEGIVEALANQLRNINSEQDLTQLALILGNGSVNDDQLKQLQVLFAEKRLNISKEDSIKLIGELKVGKKARWVITLEDGSKLQLDIEKKSKDQWQVAEVQLPQSNQGMDGEKLSPAEIAERQLAKDNLDAMNFTHNFMQTLTALDFEKARESVNKQKVSDAKIAGLCILFEEGNYAIDKTNPLQSIRLKDNIAAFYANVISSNKQDQIKAQFSITTVRAHKENPWQIDEINLDQLLADYAKRVAGGDAYYSPLIKNPNGGETLVIYFDFDSEGLTDRTKSQLDIVTHLLKLDHRKKINLSGHTDSKGGSEYNQGLSKERANAVKSYLLQSGILDSQIALEAHGFNKPRRPDIKSDGSDDPNARRANRRTEIYLDF